MDHTLLKGGGAINSGSFIEIPEKFPEKVFGNSFQRKFPNHYQEQFSGTVVRKSVVGQMLIEIQTNFYRKSVRVRPNSVPRVLPETGWRCDFNSPSSNHKVDDTKGADASW